MPHPQIDRTHEIPGWASDLESSRGPGIPRESKQGGPEKSGPIQGGVKAMMPRVKIYHSLERASITPVFGTAVPPHGLSGVLKDIAYRKISEDRLSHWLLLYASDRVDVVESWLEELFLGRKSSPGWTQLARGLTLLGGAAVLMIYLNQRQSIRSSELPTSA